MRPFQEPGKIQDIFPYLSKYPGELFHRLTYFVFESRGDPDLTPEAKFLLLDTHQDSPSHSQRKVVQIPRLPSRSSGPHAL